MQIDLAETEPSWGRRSREAEGQHLPLLPAHLSRTSLVRRFGQFAGSGAGNPHGFQSRKYSVRGSRT